MYRVIQWATGGVGKAAIQGVLRHPELELVGCWVHSDDKNGRDVGELIGEGPIGVCATTDVDALLALDADCVMYSPLLPDEQVVARILRSGKNVVTPGGMGLPGPAEPGRAGHRGGLSGRRSHAARVGYPPGRHHRTLPVDGLLAVLGDHPCPRRGVLRYPDLQRSPGGARGDGLRTHPGAGDERPDCRAVGGRVQGLGADGRRRTGFRSDPKIRSTQEVAVAVHGTDELVVPMAAGTVAARRFRWQAIVDDVPVVTAAVNWLMCEVDLDPPWTLGEQGERFEVEITGDPDVSLTFKGLQPETVAEGLERNPGVVATANHCISAIPYVCQAAPGIKTYLDLPLIAGRAAPDLAR